MIRVQRCTVNDFTFPIVVNEPRSLFFRLCYSILNKPGVAPFFWQEALQDGPTRKIPGDPQD